MCQLQIAAPFQLIEMAGSNALGRGDIIWTAYAWAMRGSFRRLRCLSVQTPGATFGEATQLINGWQQRAGLPSQVKQSRFSSHKARSSSYCGRGAGDLCC